MEEACPICYGKMQLVFKSTVLCRHEAMFDSCPSCGFLRVRNPHWLDEAYSNAIASTDTGLVMRNIGIARKLAVLFYIVMGGRGGDRYLDAAGGYGMLTRLMRDYGFDFYWADKYCDNLMARGFEFNRDSGFCNAVTAFEVMEHLENPGQFVIEALLQAKSDTFIFSTELFEGAPPSVEHWWYYSLETGQHIAFFQRKTLEILAKKLGMRFFSANGLHMFTKRNISPLLFRLCVGRASSVMEPLVRKLLKSRLILDNQLMINKLRNGQEVIR
ncbi:MAG: class I SAM-dependent methyltransferase [Methylotenera sp.]|uniref:class I SAM-dependent methyltransferase n=1 Tax=Methylotenera sp. TaxID=2051956 RepID=UPI0027167F6C|nr:class I SAM-dependent methyltransferase [Methylotenera sp.]MDO9206073.1 class I SAM-dependent methyltransferase [Methylotenera sp.]MDP2402210.1 class I SAM-dependent methyltransferase [Methylotenera sp.]MDP3094279.1 class I SAM-dependent methyltransferase [Methylotenera sp.]MDZ4223970.1 class I SAM-dependent methyltransferase [Methylotenera sp.]